MSDILSPGEFSIADKIQSRDHITGRLSSLQRLYAKDPDLAQEVISYAYPNANNRPWTHDELAQRLALDPKIAGLQRAALHVIGYGLMDDPDLADKVEDLQKKRAIAKRKRERLAIKAASDVSLRFLKTASPEVVNAVFPSLGAAFDAFEGERQRQAMISQMENAAKYPAMNFTQPQMAMYAMGGDASDQPAQPSHHRHRHHRG